MANTNICKEPTRTVKKKKKNDSTTPLIEGPKCGIRGTVVIPFRLKLPSGNQSEGTKMEANSRKNKCFREERIV